MTKNRTHLLRFLYHGVRLSLGVIFIYASYDKILHPKAFAEVIYNYQILPDVLINLTAIFLPWLEILMGTFLILGFWMQGAVIWCNVLLVVYIGALSFNLVRGIDVNCGCFSTAEGSSIGIKTILWDVAFLTLSVYLLIFLFKKRTSDS